MKKSVLFLALVLSSASAFSESWTMAQEAEVKALIREGGFFLSLQQVVRGEAPSTSLLPWLARLEEPTLIGTTVRDTFLALPSTADPWLLPLLTRAPEGVERDWVIARRQDPDLVPTGKFHLSLYPVRMDLLSGVSMVLPNYDWSISYQDARQMTVQALERGYSATVHLRWIDREGLDVFDVARQVQMYAGFRPRYIVRKPMGDAPAESDLVPLPAVAPQALAGQPGVSEQVQVGLADAWQLYAGRTRWYEVGNRVLVVLISVHIERDQRLGDRDRALVKLGQLLDSIEIRH